MTDDEKFLAQLEQGQRDQVTPWWRTSESLAKHYQIDSQTPEFEKFKVAYDKSPWLKSAINAYDKALIEPVDEFYTKGATLGHLLDIAEKKSWIRGYHERTYVGPALPLIDEKPISPLKAQEIINRFVRDLVNGKADFTEPPEAPHPIDDQPKLYALFESFLVLCERGTLPTKKEVEENADWPPLSPNNQSSSLKKIGLEGLPNASTSPPRIKR